MRFKTYNSIGQLPENKTVAEFRLLNPPQLFDVVLQRLQTFSKRAYGCFAIRRAIAFKKWHMPSFLKKCMLYRLQNFKDID